MSARTPRIGHHSRVEREARSSQPEEMQMETALSRTMRLTLTAATVAFLAGCGGDANEEGAATPDSASQPTVGAAPGDVGSDVNPQEAIAFMAAANQSE